MPITTAGPPDSALQPAAGDADSQPPPPLTATPDDDDLRPHPFVLSLQALNALPHIAGIGGKVGFVKMRELRQSALAQDLWVLDLTHGDWPWQLILRAAYAPNRDIIVGAGITSFAFRLMPITKDVFEIHRVDGSVCHIHYNKRGQMGAPWVLPPPLYL